MVLELGIRRSHRVGLERLLNAQFLLREPAVRIFAVQRGAGGCRVQRQHRIERRDSPVGAESEPYTVIEQGLKGVGPAGAVMPDTRLGPAPIVDG